jgi:hypothetical protein
MATDKMIQDAWAEFTRLHEEVKRVHANAMQYQQLHSWLSQTLRLFPSSFEGLATEIPETMADLSPLSEILPIQSTPTTTGSSLETLGVMAGMAAGAIQEFQSGMTLAIRRKYNDNALGQVEKILREKGEMHFDAIVEALQESGWKGYPLDDTRALYNALQARARTNDRFINKGNNHWAVIPESK